MTSAAYTTESPKIESENPLPQGKVEETNSGGIKKTRGKKSISSL